MTSEQCKGLIHQALQRFIPGFDKSNPYIILLLVFLLAVPALPAAAQDAPEDQQYLLFEDIEYVFTSGHFNLLKDKSEIKIAVNCDPPFKLNGYLHIDKFIDDFNRKFAEYETNKIQWVSRQLETEFSVQSLNLILKNTQSERTVNYKFIFFLRKVITIEKGNVIKEWKIYYLRGLKI